MLFNYNKLILDIGIKTKTYLSKNENLNWIIFFPIATHCSYKGPAYSKQTVSLKARIPEVLGANLILSTDYF
jgi:hypothetical protein